MEGILAMIEQEKKALQNLERRCERQSVELDTIGIELLSIMNCLRDVRMETDQLHLFSA